ncbi:MAG: hypothetical protein V1793_25160 [Pseudomonadota bacterium]
MANLNGCPKCDYEFDGIDNFCEKCGYDLRPHQIKLPCCGTVFIPRAYSVNAFCPYCGAARQDTNQPEALV